MTKLNKKLVWLMLLAFICGNVLLTFPSSAAETEDLTYGGLIPQELVEQRGHTSLSSRYAEELDAIEYINEDGTRTAYVFSAPVKYRDNSGKIQRIDNTLERKSGGVWQNKGNRFTLSVYEDMEKGFALENGESRLNVMPYFPNDTSRFSGKRMQNTGKQTLAFAEAGTEVAVSATYTGFSAAITLPEGANSVAFTLSGDVQTVTSDGQTVTVMLTNGTAVEYAVQSFSDGVYELDYAGLSVAVSSVRDGYRITYTASEATVAENEQLVLALQGDVSDPSNGVQTRNAGGSVPASAHMDAGVYSNYPNTNYGSSDRCLVGVDATMGTCRTYIKFDLSALSQITSYHQVLSANYLVRELTAYDTAFQAQAYIVKAAWTESGITWNNKPSYTEILTTVNIDWSDSSVVHTRNWYDFYITRAVLAWLQGIPNHGIMIKSRVEGDVSCRAFASHQYATSSYLPSLSVTYTTDVPNMDNIGIEDEATYYIQNKRSKYYLTATGTANGANVNQTALVEGSANQKWKISVESNGYCRITPLNATSRSLAAVSNADGANVQLATNSSSTNQQFKLSRNWDGSYKILLYTSARGLRTEDHNKTDGGNVNLWTRTDDLTKSDDWTLQPIAKGAADVYSFTDEVNGNNYTWQYTASLLTTFQEMNYYANDRKNETAFSGFSSLSTSSIFVYRGHGGPGYVIFSDSSCITASNHIPNSNYYALDTKSHNDLAQLRLAAFIGCSTGMDDTNPSYLSNLVGIAYRKGAHYAFGGIDTSATHTNSVWTQQFISNCAEGMTIYDAMLAADDYLYTTFGSNVNMGNSNQRHTLGDNSLRLDL